MKILYYPEWTRDEETAINRTLGTTTYAMNLKSFEAYIDGEVVYSISEHSGIENRVYTIFYFPLMKRLYLMHEDTQWGFVISIYEYVNRVIVKLEDKRDNSVTNQQNQFMPDNRDPLKQALKEGEPLPPPEVDM